MARRTPGPRRVSVAEVRRSAIAIRDLFDSNDRKRASIYIAAPVQTDPDTWLCAFHISGLNVRGVKRAFGGDSFAAVINAISGVKYFLRDWEGILKWYAGDDGELGVPAFVTSGYGLAISRKLEGYLARETKRLIREAIQKRRGRTRRYRQPR